MKMEVIPGINCERFECVVERFKKTLEFGASWVHIDISDGKFSPALSWNNPEELIRAGGSELKRIFLEIHLMVENPISEALKWAVCAKRVIIHAEAVGDSHISIKNLHKNLCAVDCELGISLREETPPEILTPYLDYISFIQLLAVPAGFSGGIFHKSIFKKIDWLRERNPGVTIEIDGGITPEVMQDIKSRGIHYVVSSSYLWGNNNPLYVYQTLKNIS